jgi:hypothetical protein
MVEGVLSLPDGFTISRGLTKSAFLAAKKGEAIVIVENPPFSSYKLPAIPLYGVQIILTLYFVGEVVSEIHLYPLWGITSDGWGQQTLPEAEEAKRNNNRLLEQILGTPPYVYKWGEIMSILDQKSSFGQIIIRYNKM